MSDREIDIYLAEQFARDLEKLSDDNNDLVTVPNDEYWQLLELSKVMQQTDWSNGRQAKEDLKKRLELLIFENEISDDDLDWVAGGLQNPEYQRSEKKDED